MKQATLSKWLKLILVGMGICGLLAYAWIIPSFGQMLVRENPEYEHCYYPWLCFLWTTGIPCYIALVLGWKIAANIGKDRSFSSENARLLKWIAVLAAVDAGYFLFMNILYVALDLSHPGIALCSLVIVFMGIAVSVAAAALSHLVMKAAGLQEQSDLTI